MPNVYLKVSKRVSPLGIKILANVLTEIVALALSTNGPDGILYPKEVAVMPEQLSDFALNTFDVDVTVIANVNEERKANLEARQKMILTTLCDNAEKIDRNLSVGVYLVLGEGSFNFRLPKK